MSLSLFRLGSFAAGIGMVSCASMAAITATVSFDCTSKRQSAATVEKGITGTIGVGGGDGQIDPVMIKRIRGIIELVVTSGPRSALSVQKSALIPAQAFGADRPNGYDGLPYAGPYVGAMWPFRDVRDFAVITTPTTTQPNGNTLGDIASPTLGTFRIGQIPASGGPLGLLSLGAIGGPTETIQGAPRGVESLLRGIPGNGAQSLDSTGRSNADFFGFDIVMNDLLERTVEIRFLNASVDVVGRNRTTGEYSEINNIPVPDTTFIMVVPAPGAAGLGLVLLGVASRRRR